MMGKLERILLIEPKSPSDHIFSKFAMPRLGLPLLGAILKSSGYDVKIIVEELEHKKRIDYNRIADFRPDLVGISTTTSTAPAAYDIADHIKKLFNITVAFGGVHVSFMPEEALMHGDYVLRKEADFSFLTLLDSLNSNQPLESVTFFPKTLSQHLPKVNFYNGISRFYGRRAMLKNKKPFLTYVQKYIRDQKEYIHDHIPGRIQ